MSAEAGSRREWAGGSHALADGIRPTLKVDTATPAEPEDLPFGLDNYSTQSMRRAPCMHARLGPIGGVQKGGVSPVDGKQVDGIFGVVYEAQDVSAETDTILSPLILLETSHKGALTPTSEKKVEEGSDITGAYILEGDPSPENCEKQNTGPMKSGAVQCR